MLLNSRLHFVHCRSRCCDLNDFRLPWGMRRQGWRVVCLCGFAHRHCSSSYCVLPPDWVSMVVRGPRLRGETCEIRPHAQNIKKIRAGLTVCSITRTAECSGRRRACTPVAGETRSDQR